MRRKGIIISYKNQACLVWFFFFFSFSLSLRVFETGKKNTSIYLGIIENKKEATVGVN